jgi:glyoxylase-like metal-dependent hydrolase (beta-lactamase superfamily II)
MAPSQEFLIPPKPAKDLEIPVSSSTVQVSVVDTTAILYMPSSIMFKPQIADMGEIIIPCFSFLISHPSGRKIVFDLGIRKDWQNSTPPMIKYLQNANITLDVAKDVAEILKENGHEPEDIEAIVWSHFHFDHAGDPATFPKSTKLVVGSGFKERFDGKAWPTNENSVVREDAWQGRELMEVAFKEGEKGIGKIGSFKSFDYFGKLTNYNILIITSSINYTKTVAGDGSFYLLDTPGHATGHMCGLARTTASPDASFIFMGGDAAHHVGLVRPSECRPLPTQIKLDPKPNNFPVVCPGELVMDLQPRKKANQPFFEIQESFNDDAIVTRNTIDGVTGFDADDNVFVIIAHDGSLTDLIDFYPTPANDWKAKGWGVKGRWRFLTDFKSALPKE